MKITDVLKPGLVVLGVAGIAASAALGFAAGVVAGRDPEALRRTARRVAGEAARGLERATLFAAQAREHIGDLWAEAREEALAEVDAADFEKAAARSGKTSAEAPPRRAPARKRAGVKRTPRPRKPREAEAQAADIDRT